DEVLEVLTDGMHVAEVVVLLDEGLDEVLFGRASDLADVEGADVGERSGERDGRDVDLGDDRVATRLPRRPHRRGQHEMSGAVELEHQGAAEGIAGRAVGLRPGPGLAELERERSPG